MIEPVIVQGLFKLTLAVVGIVLARYTLVWMDRCLKETEFGVWLKNANDYAKAVYYGSRILAAAVVVGLAIS